jgi:hypothetical protein
MPGSYQAVYNGTKAFLDSFSMALRNELKDSGVTVSCLMPGPTDTEFFERADMLDTKVGQGKKADPAEVARIGFEAMLDGEGDVVAGRGLEEQAAGRGGEHHALVDRSAAERAEQHRKMARAGVGAQRTGARPGGAVGLQRSGTTRIPASASASIWWRQPYQNSGKPCSNSTGGPSCGPAVAT